jgi:hypothetical protein
VRSGGHAVKAVGDAVEAILTAEVVTELKGANATAIGDPACGGDPFEAEGFQRGDELIEAAGVDELAH